MENEQNEQKEKPKGLVIPYSIFLTMITSLLSIVCTGTFIFAWNLNARFAVLENVYQQRSNDITEVKADVKSVSKDVNELKGQFGVMQIQLTESTQKK